MTDEREGLRTRVEAMLNGCTYEGCGDEDHETLREVLALLAQTQEPVGWYDPDEAKEASQVKDPWVPMYLDGEWENATVPLYASPVASAPEPAYVEITCVGCDCTGEVPVEGDTLDISDIGVWTLTSDTGWKCPTCASAPEEPKP